MPNNQRGISRVSVVDMVCVKNLEQKMMWNVYFIGFSYIGKEMKTEQFFFLPKLTADSVFEPDQY